MRNLRLLIVDDESTTRNGLKKALDWEQFHIEEVREAIHGQDALELLASYEADIVLTDIRMPFMTGVELAEVLVERFPKIKIIFLSAYSDKEYLKSAIHLGVVNYVEKPVDIDELSTAIEKAVDLCHQDMEIDVIKQRSGISEKTVIENLIRQNQQSLEIQEQIAMIAPELLEQEHFSVLIFRVKEEVSATEIMREIEFVFNEKVFDRKGEVVVLSTVKDDHHILSVLGWKKEKAYQEQIEKLRIFLTQEPWNLQVFLGIGSEVQNLGEVYQSYQGAVIALQGLFVAGFGKIVLYKSELFRQNSTFHEDEILQEFRERCQGLEKEKILSYMKQFYQGIKLNKNYFANEIKNLSVNLYNELYKEAQKQRAFQKNENAEEEEFRYIWDHIFRIETFDELRAFIEGKMDGLLLEIEWCSRYSKTIRLVMKKIEEHYRESDLSTNRLAAEVYLTDAYLSTLFKKEVGITISRYIQNLRMEKAKDLLKSKALNIAEIAEQVGYTDANYFAKTFRKIYGKAPSEFRERMW